MVDPTPASSKYHEIKDLNTQVEGQRVAELNGTQKFGVKGNHGIFDDM